MTNVSSPVLSPRKEEILHHAQALFSEMGYKAASMRKLAERLGIEAGSLYSSFNKKEDMLWHIAQRCATDFDEAVRPIFASDLPWVVRLQKMIEAHIEVLIRNQNASAIFFREWKHLSHEKRSEYQARQRDYEQMFVQTLEGGQKAGVFAQADNGFITRTLLSGTNWISRWYRPDGSLSVQEIKRQLSALTLNGICTPEAKI